MNADSIKGLVQALVDDDAGNVLELVERVVAKHGPRIIGWLGAIEKSGVLRAMAKLNARYYKDLVKAGFTSAQAIELVKNSGLRALSSGEK